MKLKIPSVRNPFFQFTVTKKKAAVIGAVVLAAAVLVFYTARSGTLQQDPVSASFVRTTVLQKTSLDHSISLSGTVESAEVSTVTTSQTLTVQSIPVQVGDWVEAGDVICVLDSTEVEKSIADAQQTLQEAVNNAQENLSTAQQNLSWAQEEADTAYSAMTAAQEQQSGAQSALQAAQDSISAFQSAVDSASAVLQNATAALNNALSAAQDNPDDASLSQQVQQCQAEVTAAQQDLSTAQSELSSAQSAMNIESLQAAATSAATAYDQALSTWNSARDYRDSCQQQVESAQQALTDASADDTLEELQQTLANCTLTAPTAGKITAINVTVGAMAGNNTTIAEIQNTDSLKIAVTIPEYEIQNVELGMTARITTDATEGTIEGTLTQISPVASSDSGSSGFSAEVSVNTADSGLYVGINATVEIIQSTTEDVFVVPLDAIGINEAGESIVYVLESGTALEGQWREVVVTTGDSNDYYVEIASDQLSEGMEIRSSASLDQAQVSAEEQEETEQGSQDNVQIDMGGMPSATEQRPFGGEMPGGGNGGPGGGY